MTYEEIVEAAFEKIENQIDDISEFMQAEIVQRDDLFEVQKNIYCISIIQKYSGRKMMKAYLLVFSQIFCKEVF
jgi:hypothetical protein